MTAKQNLLHSLITEATPAIYYKAQKFKSFGNRVAVNNRVELLKQVFTKS